MFIISTKTQRKLHYNNCGYFQGYRDINSNDLNVRAEIQYLS